MLPSRRLMSSIEYLRAQPHDTPSDEGPTAACAGGSTDSSSRMLRSKTAASFLDGKALLPSGTETGRLCVPGESVRLDSHNDPFLVDVASRHDDELYLAVAIGLGTMVASVAMVLGSGFGKRKQASPAGERGGGDGSESRSRSPSPPPSAARGAAR
eukprot:gnl/TRDRNA2_/TRDRNA2_158406_c0_seq2.p1 gnl/TRDRNA2_/TRDRNA2_158406_c0~~gnl/TRDRNA2_/TRDRNA2_158406_c0_seq2.p1  ORF type:complete len:156 (-),score=22.57 gnl/TRDRNA2_/TRDRNA2_158406_c0_seq2:136-603(-)